jgi:predicted component of type VI protein secretion system
MLARFPMTRCGAMADSITAHLAYVAADSRFEEPVRRAARDAVGEWKAITEMQVCLARQRRMPG